MPFSGIPARNTFRRSSSERRVTSGLVAMSGARSPPRPSRPWQDAQVAAKVCGPADAAVCSECVGPAAEIGFVCCAEVVVIAVITNNATVAAGSLTFLIELARAHHFQVVKT